MGYNCSSYKWYAETEKYKEIRNKLGRHIKRDELKNFGLHSENWFRYNAPIETKIKTMNDFLVWCGYEKLTRDFTKEESIKQILEISKNIDRPLKITDFQNTSVNSIDINIINKYWGNFNNAKRELGLKQTGTYRGHNYSKEELIHILQDFVKENGFVPTSKFIEENSKKYNLPDRKTFTNYFGSVMNAISEAGFEYQSKIKRKNINDKNISIWNDKELLTDIIYLYIEKYNHVPTARELWDEQGLELKSYYRKYFGGWNNCLKELGLKLNAVSYYNDIELKDAFMNFASECDRVPTIKDFNGTGRPSFWVYQNRFGSWAETCINYGFKPNCREIKYYMDDGEVCDSSYEFDISTWLKKNGIKYERNVKYIDFITSYKGKMNCDYQFTLDNGTIWYVEMAGFLHTHNFKKLKQRPEQVYYFKIKYKEKLLKRENCNYLIISVDDMKQKSLSEIFYFLHIDKEVG